MSHLIASLSWSEQLAADDCQGQISLLMRTPKAQNQSTHNTNPPSGTNGEPLRRLLERLQDTARFTHPVETFELIETHISYVLLTGTYAYKFKKPVDLGFLDFSTLEKRRFFCHEELRLNKRLAASLYDAVVTITGSVDEPHIDGTGPVIDYAVRMRQFPPADRLDRVCERGELTAAHIDQLADDLAAFHRRAPVAAHNSIHGTAATISARVEQNFEQIAQHSDVPSSEHILKALKTWVNIKQTELQDDMAIRHYEGWIRECHGDLHLANCALIDGQVVIFDALEFAEDLRWIDPLSEIAFLYMDLDQRGEKHLARRFLNRYLENANDYQSLNLLPYYLVYRAMVRAKVAAIESHQHRNDTARRNQANTQLSDYLDRAMSYSYVPEPPPLILLHGLSGSGKSWLARKLVETLGAICIRSDVERKRLLGFDPVASTRSRVAEGAYSAEITDKVYKRLYALTYPVLDAGFPVLIDATCLRESQRTLFQRLARVAGVPFVILSLHAPDDILRSRILNRNQHERDASEATLAVLDHQLTIAEPLTDEEVLHAIVLDSTTNIDLDKLVKSISERHSHAGKC